MTKLGGVRVTSGGRPDDRPGWRESPPETAVVLGGPMRKVQSLSILVSLLWVCCAWGQESPGLSKRLTNQDILSMVELGLSEDVIIAKIRSVSAAGAGNASFDTSVEGLK